MNCSMSGFPVLHYLPEFAQTLLHCVKPYSHLILCRLLLLLPSVFPRIRVFSNELALHTRWPKYWCFSFSLSNEYSGLISFRTGLISFLYKGLSRIFSSTTVRLGHLMWRASSLEETLMLGKIVGRKRGVKRMRWWDGITVSMDMCLRKLSKIVKDKETCFAAMHVITKCQTWLSNWTIPVRT